MASDERLSIREISRRIEVPESTLRYYRNIFPEHIPTIGSGRRRRHPERAVAVFELISRLFGAGESRESIRRRLEGLKPPPNSGGRWDLVRSAREEVASEDAEEERAVGAPARLGSGQVEQLITAMMVRDRELAAMHRELLDLVGRLIRALESEVGAPKAPTAEPVTEEGAAARAGSEMQDRRLPVAELEELRESLSREQETVERLRRAKLELEQRLARMEREGGERGGRSRRR